MTPSRLLPALLLVCGTLACGRVSEDQARNLVARYNQVVSEAYRRNDIRLIDAVVAPDCVAGRNLTGLIGVRIDMGLTMDSRLEDLQVTGVSQPAKDALEVRTRERWSYRDLRAGTGQQVGEASTDHYELLYLFHKVKGTWMVTETTFTAPPQVGRKEAPWQMDARDAHAMIAPPTPTGGKP